MLLAWKIIIQKELIISGMTHLHSNELLGLKQKIYITICMLFNAML